LDQKVILLSSALLRAEVAAVYLLDFLCCCLEACKFTVEGNLLATNWSVHI